MSSDRASNNKRLVKNSIFLYFRMILTMVVSLYTSRIILKALGVTDFGVFSVVSGFVSIFSFISGSMIASTERFLNYNIGKTNDTELVKIFNASRIIHIVLALVVILLSETIGLWYLYNKIVIPPDRLVSAFWVFQFSVITAAILFVTFPYNAAIIAHEHMNVFAYISILEVTLKLLIVFLLSLAGLDKLIMYSVLLFVVQLLITNVYRIYCLKNFKETKFNIKNIPFKLYKELLSFSGWNLFGNIASIALNQGTNILLNLFFGPTINAAKGISLQIQTAVNSFFGNFQLAQNPQIIKSYAAGEYEYFHDLIFRSSRFSFFLALIIVVPIFLYTSEFMVFWLVNVPAYTVPFVQYTLIFSLISTLATPLITGSMATGNVKKIMTTIAVFFWLIIPAGYITLKLGYDPVSIFIVQLIFYIVAHILRIWIISQQLKFSVTSYIFTVLIPILIVSFVTFALSFFIKKNIIFFNSGEFLHVIISSFIFVVITIGVIFVIGINNKEKNFLFENLKKFIKK